MVASSMRPTALDELKRISPGIPTPLLEWVAQSTPAGWPIEASGGDGDWSIPTPPPSQEAMARAVEWVSTRFLGRNGVNAVWDRWNPPAVEVRTETQDQASALARGRQLPVSVDGIAVMVRAGGQIRPYYPSGRRIRLPRATITPMYSNVSALRSTRYPLAGLGCPCNSPAPVAGLGQLLPAVGGFAAGVTLAAAGGLGLITGYWLGGIMGRRAERHRRLMYNRRRR